MGRYTKFRRLLRYFMRIHEKEKKVDKTIFFSILRVLIYLILYYAPTPKYSSKMNR